MSDLLDHFEVVIFRDGSCMLTEVTEGVFNYSCA